MESFSWWGKGGGLGEGEGGEVMEGAGEDWGGGGEMEGRWRQVEHVSI